MWNRGGHKPQAPKKANGQQGEQKRKTRLSKEDIEMLNENWQNNELTSHLWELISSGNTQALQELVTTNPAAAHVRSEDGRGPMWWAHEYKRSDMIEILRKAKVSEDRTDESGRTPLEF